MTNPTDPDAVARERAAVVAWLRKQKARCDKNYRDGWALFLKRWWWCSIAYDIAADAIECGDHLVRDHLERGR